jgi:hypothetical protein
MRQSSPIPTAAPTTGHGALKRAGGGAFAKRLAIGAVALYALLLQAFLAAAAPAAALGLSGGVICAPGASLPEAPAKQDHRRHHACCLAVCAAAACACVTLASAAPGLLDRSASLIVFAPRLSFSAAPRFAFPSVARGPPPRL